MMRAAMRSEFCDLPAAIRCAQALGATAPSILDAIAPAIKHQAAAPLSGSPKVILQALRLSEGGLSF
jgi:hypothetical protein